MEHACGAHHHRHRWRGVLEAAHGTAAAPAAAAAAWRHHERGAALSATLAHSAEPLAPVSRLASHSALHSTPQVVLESLTMAIYPLLVTLPMLLVRAGALRFLEPCVLASHCVRSLVLLSMGLGLTPFSQAMRTLLGLRIEMLLELLLGLQDQVGGRVHSGEGGERRRAAAARPGAGRCAGPGGWARAVRSPKHSRAAAARPGAGRLAGPGGWARAQWGGRQSTAGPSTRRLPQLLPRPPPPPSCRALRRSAPRPWRRCTRCARWPG